MMHIICTYDVYNFVNGKYAHNYVTIVHVFLIVCIILFCCVAVRRLECYLPCKIVKYCSDHFLYVFDELRLLFNAGKHGN